MIHVADVRATAAWYQTVGFTLRESHGDGGEGLSFAILSAGDTRLMLNQGGRPGTAERREVDLYVETDAVDQLFASLVGRVHVVEEVADAEYGMREFIIRDPNGFWITFGQHVGGTAALDIPSSTGAMGESA